MNETGIIPVSDSPIQKYDDAAIKAAEAANVFLPRLQLMTANSEVCKKTDGFPTNHYALIRDQQHVDLGAIVDVAVLSFRPMALDVSNKDEIISCYDPKLDENDKATGEFARIQRQSFTKDSGCLFGLQYLVFVPQTKCFATFAMISKSARRESPQMKARHNQAATLSSCEAKSGGYTWYKPVVKDCTDELELPDKSVMIEEINKFQNPPEDVELAPDVPGDDAR